MTSQSRSIEQIFASITGNTWPGGFVDCVYKMIITEDPSRVRSMVLAD